MLNAEQVQQMMNETNTAIAYLAGIGEEIPKEATEMRELMETCLHAMTQAEEWKAKCMGMQVAAIKSTSSSPAPSHTPSSQP